MAEVCLGDSLDAPRLLLRCSLGLAAATLPSSSASSPLPSAPDPRLQELTPWLQRAVAGSFPPPVDSRPSQELSDALLSARLGAAVDTASDSSSPSLSLIRASRAGRSFRRLQALASRCRAAAVLPSSPSSPLSSPSPLASPPHPSVLIPSLHNPPLASSPGPRSSPSAATLQAFAAHLETLLTRRACEMLAGGAGDWPLADALWDAIGGSESLDGERLLSLLFSAALSPLPGLSRAFICCLLPYLAALEGLPSPLSPPPFFMASAEALLSSAAALSSSLISISCYFGLSESSPPSSPLSSSPPLRGPPAVPSAAQLWKSVGERDGPGGGLEEDAVGFVDARVLLPMRVREQQLDDQLGALVAMHEPLRRLSDLLFKDVVMRPCRDLRERLQVCIGDVLCWTSPGFAVLYSYLEDISPSSSPHSSFGSPHPSLECSPQPLLVAFSPELLQSLEGLSRARIFLTLLTSHLEGSWTAASRIPQRRTPFSAQERAFAASRHRALLVARSLAQLYSGLAHEPWLRHIAPLHGGSSTPRGYRDYRAAQSAFAALVQHALALLERPVTRQLLDSLRDGNVAPSDLPTHLHTVLAFDQWLLRQEQQAQKFASN